MSIEAMKQAFEALESYHGYMEPLTTVFGGPRVPIEQSTTGKVEKAITSLRQAIANEALNKKAENARELGLDYEPSEQEPVAWYIREKDSATTDGCWAEENLDICEPVYTHPQPKQWVGLTGEQICDCWNLNGEQFYKNIESKLKELNT